MRDAAILAHPGGHGARQASEHWSERFQGWIAALASLLLHGLVLLVAMLVPPVTMTPPEGASSGSWIQVEFIGETPDGEQQAIEPPASAARTSERREPTTRRVRPLQSTRAPVAQEQIPRPDPERAAAPQPEPAPQPDDAMSGQGQSSVPPPATRRYPGPRGQPPGMIVQPPASQGTGLVVQPTRSEGNAREPVNADASMSVGGYHVFYDLSSEPRLRRWQEQGMTEIFIPLPGSKQHMVCPLETALRRDSGECRLLDPDDPAMDTIGDARDVIRVVQVHQRGKLLWRGPGAYR